MLISTIIEMYKLKILSSKEISTLSDEILRNQEISEILNELKNKKNYDNFQEISNIANKKIKAYEALTELESFLREIFERKKYNFSSTIELSPNNFLTLSIERCTCVLAEIPNQKNFSFGIAVDMEHDCYFFSKPHPCPENLLIEFNGDLRNNDYKEFTSYFSKNLVACSE